MADGLLEAVRGLWLADPELGPKPLLAKLREQQPDLGAGNKEVREALLLLALIEGGAARPRRPPPPCRPQPQHHPLRARAPPRSASELN